MALSYKRSIVRPEERCRSFWSLFSSLSLWKESRMQLVSNTQPIRHTFFLPPFLSLRVVDFDGSLTVTVWLCVSWVCVRTLLSICSVFLFFLFWYDRSGSSSSSSGRKKTCLLVVDVYMCIIHPFTVTFTVVWEEGREDFDGEQKKKPRKEKHS